jgi:hypothetical protein
MKLRDFRITLNNITQYCNDIPNGIDQIYEVIMFNPNMKTHLCSLTPSQDYVRLWHTCTVTDEYYELSDEGRELVWDYELELRLGNSSWYDYFDKVVTPSIPIPDSVWDIFFSQDEDVLNTYNNNSYVFDDDIVALLDTDIDIHLTVTAKRPVYKRNTKRKRKGHWTHDEYEIDFPMMCIQVLRNFLLDWNSSNEINIVIENGAIKSFN